MAYFPNNFFLQRFCGAGGPERSVALVGAWAVVERQGVTLEAKVLQPLYYWRGKWLSDSDLGDAIHFVFLSISYTVKFHLFAMKFEKEMIQFDMRGSRSPWALTRSTRQGQGRYCNACEFFKSFGVAEINPCRRATRFINIPKEMND